MLNPRYPMDLRTRRRCFRGFVKVCGEHGILPSSYIIPKSKIEKLGDSPFSSGGFSNIWPGMYKEDEDEEGRCVAIKVVRYCESDDVQKIKNASYFDPFSSRWSLTVHTELLPRGHHLEASVSPERFGVNRGRDG